MDRRSKDSKSLWFREQLALSRGGDHDAFGHLLDCFREYLLAIAQHQLDRALRARVGPSDVVQETFVQAARRFEDFRGVSEAELRAWLRAILVNCCRGFRDAHLLAAKRDARREVGIGAVDSNANFSSVPANGEPPSSQAVAAEDAGRLLAALSLLPEDLRQIVWLRNWEGMGFEEIGMRTGRSSDAARKIFSRAIEKLGRVLEATDG